MIEVQNLHKAFGSNQVLNGISFHLEPGEVVALAGPNGAGKTTTLRILMGFLGATSGTVRVHGEDPLSRRHLGQLGWMPERPSFPSRFRVRRLIAFQAATFPGWDTAFATELLERFELQPSARADKLSRGQTARLALLLALGHKPRLLLLDDPTLGLDPTGRRLLLGELLAAAVDAGSGVLLSTHLLAEADWSLDRILILRHGEIRLDQEAEELRARCRKLHVSPGVEIPEELGPLDGPDGLLLTAYDEERWSRFQSRVPEARCEVAGLEDIYIAMAETCSLKAS